MQIIDATHYERIILNLKSGDHIFDNDGTEYRVCAENIPCHIEHGDLFIVETGEITHFSQAEYPLGLEEQRGVQNVN